MNGWMDGRMVGWTDGWINKSEKVFVVSQMYGWMDKCNFEIVFVGRCFDG